MTQYNEEKTKIELEKGAKIFHNDVLLDLYGDSTIATAPKTKRECKNLILF